MKKLLLLVLSAIMLLSVFACDKKKPETDKGPTFMAWTTHMTNKLVANRDPESTGTTKYTVYMTRGESEGCQLVVYSPENIKKGSLKLVSKVPEGITASMFALNRTHRFKRQDWTDSAVPYYGAALKIEAEKIVPFIVDFKTTSETAPGDYTFKYEFTDLTTKETLATFEVTVHVWDIVLPEEKTFGTSIGLNVTLVKEQGDSYQDFYQKYYEMLLEHGLSARPMPYDVLDEKADAYMSDPRVTSFLVGFWELQNWEDERILEYYNKLKTNPEWLKKGFFYVIDEPRSEADLKKYNELCNRLQNLCPGIQVLAPFYTNNQTGPNSDQVDAMAAETQHWCPKLCLWDDSQSYDKFLKYDPEKSFAERMKEFQAEGDKVWAYVCNDPIDPYAQLFIDTAGVNQRLMFWQMYQRDIEGFLYWGSTSWQGIDPWEKSDNGVGDGKGNPVYGDGWLLYPGMKIGIPSPIPSIRLKIVRDGIDDVELLYLAEKALGKDRIMEWANEATPSLTTYTTDDRFHEIRIEIGNALEAAMKAQ